MIYSSTEIRIPGILANLHGVGCSVNRTSIYPFLDPIGGVFVQIRNLAVQYLSLFDKCSKLDVTCARASSQGIVDHAVGAYDVGASHVSPWV